jgi:hypothetical protein
VLEQPKPKKGLLLGSLGDCTFAVAIILCVFLLIFVCAPQNQPPTTNETIREITGETDLSTRLMGIFDFDQYTAFGNEQLAFIKAQGANTVQTHLYLDRWNSNANLNGTPYKTFYANFATWAHNNGLKYILCCDGISGAINDSKYNAVYNSVAKTTWLNTYADMVSTLQPDGVNLMNEPFQTINVVDLKDWYADAIDTYLVEKGDLSFIVAGVPFWDPSGLLTTPRLDVTYSGNTFYYGTHLYYCLDGEQMEPEVYDWADDYWYGNLAAAKTELNTWILTRGVQACLNAGVNVIFDEFGCSNLANNYLSFEADVFDLADAYNIGVLWVGWWTAGSGFSSTGVLSNWTPTLNANGNLWASNMPPSGGGGTLTVAVAEAIINSMRRR